MATPSDPGKSISLYQLILVALAVLVLATLVIDTVAPMPPEASKMVQRLDLAACALFFIDFLVRFRRAENKWAFMKWGWIDLLASIPAVDAFRFGRLVRVLRVIRLLRGVRLTHRVLTMLLRREPQNVFGSVLAMTMTLMMVASVAVLAAETAPESKIKTATDALWWSVTTLTTVGYGDLVPVTTAGRWVGMGLMICGLGLFGTLSGMVATFFLGEQESSEAKLLREVLDRLQALDGKMGRS